MEFSTNVSVTGEVLRGPEPPEFSSVDEEREFRKHRLALAFRMFADWGFEDGAAGHITVRDPENLDQFWVNPFCFPFSQITTDDLVLVDHAGAIVRGRHPINTAAFAIHSELHRNRPEVVAAAHSHSTYGKAFSTQGRLLQPISQDACAFYKSHGLFDDYTGIVFSNDEGKRIAHALDDYKAVILRNHGLVTVGESVDSAVWWYVAMDRACHVQLLADSAGTPVEIDPDEARKTNEQVGAEHSGWLSAQPMFADAERIYGHLV